jgi:hypothetical protein
MAHAILWDGPEPVGYDPRIIPQWRDEPTSEEFAC